MSSKLNKGLRITQLPCGYRTFKNHVPEWHKGILRAVARKGLSISPATDRK